MTLGKWAWVGGGVWLGCGMLLLTFYVLAEVVANYERGRRAVLLTLAVRLPLATPVILCLWPILLAVLCYVVHEVLREQALESACSTGWAPPPRPRLDRLTEEEWLRGTSAVRLLQGVPAQRCDRAARLFALACCRRVEPLLSDERSRRALQVAERYADGQAGLPDLQEALREAHAAAVALHATGDLAATLAAKACHDACAADAVCAAERAALAHYRRRRAERRAQCGPLRCIYGNPLRPLPPLPLPAEVRALAQACAEGDVALYGLLADALEDLGQPEAAAHCREPGHVKGCHVVDWALGRA
jgi:hypothetical protein